MLNTITLMGRMVGNPELRATNAGVTCAKFRIAVDRDYENKDGNRTTDFIDCIAWRSTSGFISRNFRKGDMICVNGSLYVNSWKDETGGYHSRAEVQVQNVYFCGSKRNTAKAEDQTFTDINDDESDLPWSMDDDDELPL